ncbi:pilus assembly protein TadG-related protein [Sphingomonas sp.]|uniref:pilus assembly protein TadG-related protein n=1 Tax=Sphingomonas sp. TaxID=28214 RepID=UPI002DD6732A|nr:pilus assembly protein TadG-related protein [Sphingomonas sp.]
MTSLVRDVRANTLVIMTAALIPLAGMVGGGVDLSRMYILKTRLQHACDAGALAGRKAMGGGTWAYQSYYPRTQAEMFFAGNFETGSFGSTGLSRSFTENAGRVSGTASATLPMTLMRIFGRTTETLTVTCASEMRLPNTDVMFVLDTTGSMSSSQPGDTVDKMTALKTAVKCFYEIVARLDTNAACTTGTPSGGTGESVQIRFGFVPYATNVNVGKLLPTEWFADTWNYQTREATYSMQNTYTFPTPAGGGGSQTGSSDGTATTSGWTSDPSAERGAWLGAFCLSSYTPTSVSDAGPESAPQNVQASSSGSTQTVTWQTTQTVTRTEWREAGSSGGRCRYEKRTVTFTRTKTYSRTENGTITQTPTFSGWRYAQLPVNVGLLKNGTEWRNSFEWPTGNNATNRTINWDGCIEERQTVRTTNYSTIPSGAKDMDIDMVPTPGDQSTLWGMVLPDVTHTRNGSTWTLNTTTTTANYGNNSYYACPTESRKLQTWPVASAFDSYVDSLSPEGNTYHDIGLIWGARLLSPTGLFQTENQFTPKGGEIERHLIFMTDGDACTAADNYTAYGVQWYDRRQTNAGSVPSGGCTYNSYTLTEQVNKRTEALCTAIKNKNITLWVIAFGNLATETETRLQNCATSSRYFKATSAAQLQATFKSIADQISMLRLTQ